MQALFMLFYSYYAQLQSIIELKARKRKVSFQVILSGIIYLLQNGCKWEGLPPQYGNYKTIWYCYHK